MSRIVAREYIVNEKLSQDSVAHLEYIEHYIGLKQISLGIGVGRWGAGGGGGAGPPII